MAEVSKPIRDGQPQDRPKSLLIPCQQIHRLGSISHDLLSPVLEHVPDKVVTSNGAAIAVHAWLKLAIDDLPCHSNACRSVVRQSPLNIVNFGLAPLQSQTTPLQNFSSKPLDCRNDNILRRHSIDIVMSSPCHATPHTAVSVKLSQGRVKANGKEVSTGRIPLDDPLSTCLPPLALALHGCLRSKDYPCNGGEVTQ